MKLVTYFNSLITIYLIMYIRIAIVAMNLIVSFHANMIVCMHGTGGELRHTFMMHLCSLRLLKCKVIAS